jgi:hypothetical protein
MTKSLIGWTIIYDEIEDMPKTVQELTELMIPLCEKLKSGKI